ncbi:MAG: helix-turn-helix transcriptional regulator [Xenococcaceae cyanobacterium MO_167.B27]|nr:helix-turn-helix transcriptional regulator [Xenococcaceae cyanobacterium MO_167.B27]
MSFATITILIATTEKVNCKITLVAAMIDMSIARTETRLKLRGKIMPMNQVLMGLYMPIKWRLAVLMADREINYKELAKLTGFHEKTVSKHKNLRVMPSRLEDSTLLKYCEALDCQPGDLLVYIPQESVKAKAK